MTNSPLLQHINENSLLIEESGFKSIRKAPANISKFIDTTKHRGKVYLDDIEFATPSLPNTGQLTIQNPLYDPNIGNHIIEDTPENRASIQNIYVNEYKSVIEWLLKDNARSLTNDIFIWINDRPIRSDENEFEKSEDVVDDTIHEMSGIFITKYAANSGNLLGDGQFSIGSQIMVVYKQSGHGFNKIRVDYQD